MSLDLFIAAGEPSGDLHGASLIQSLLRLRPHLKIGAVAGPKMRACNMKEYFRMEDLSVMGFIDVLFALPRIARQFFKIRNKILELSPKAVVLIDYPGFHLRLERSLKKKGYRGKLIHWICPTVWAWGKKRIPLMAEHLDLLLTLFPFEPACFAHTPLPVLYTGHPLVQQIAQFVPSHKFGGKILGLFPGSRKAEIERNLPLQLKIAQRLQKLDPSLQIAVSLTRFPLDIPNVLLVPPEDNYELMRGCHAAIATSGTVTLELALHQIPTVVTYAITPFDCFLAQKIFKINLPFYCIVNILLNRSIFPELFGPNLTEEQLFFWTEKMWLDPFLRNQTLEGCQEVRKSLDMKDPSQCAAEAILSSMDF